MTESDTQPQTDPMEQMICFDLYAASQAFTRAYKPLLEPLGLTYPQYLVMLNLWARAPLTVGHIGQCVGLESNTLTPLIKRLQDAGLVTRERDPGDERRVSVALTAKGAALEPKAVHVPAGILAATGMTPKELLALQKQLRALTRGMQSAVGQK